MPLLTQILAVVSGHDLSLLFILIALGCLLAAGYVGLHGNLPAAVVLIIVAVVAVVIGT